MTYIEITDRQGQRRRARPGEVAQDGETFYFPQTFMDAAAVLAEKYGKPAVTDHRPQGFVRGYAYVASTSVSRDARAEAAKAYDERSARIANAWQKKQQDADAPAHTQDAAQAKGLADSAWQGKKARLQNAWRAR